MRKKEKKRKKEKGRRSETRVNSSSINLGFVFFRVANTVASKERLNIARLHRHRGVLLFVAVDSWMTASLKRRYYTDGGMYSNG